MLIILQKLVHMKGVLSMSDEKEYVSILDGVEDDEPIVIIPDDEDEERDYSVSSGHAGAVIRDEIEERTPQKRTFFSIIRDFWYYHKTAFLLTIFLLSAVIFFIATLNTKSSVDFTAAVCTDKYYSNEEMIALKLVLSEHIEDFNDDDSNAVEADFLVTDNNDYTPSQIAADYNDGVRCIYFTTEKSFEYIIGIYPDMFESYNGCDEWIPLSGTDLCVALKVQGFDASDLGISLLAKPEGDTKHYDRAVSLLDSLRENYPEVFD